MIDTNKATIYQGAVSLKLTCRSGNRAWANQRNSTLFSYLCKKVKSCNWYGSVTISGHCWYITRAKNSPDSNKLPKVKLADHDAMLLPTPFVPTVRQRWPLSECMDIDIDFLITLKMIAVTKHQQFAEWNAMYLLPIPYFLISHFSFLISSFLLLEWPGSYTAALETFACEQIT